MQRFGLMVIIQWQKMLHLMSTWLLSIDYVLIARGKERRFLYEIPGYLKSAYEAGKRGELLEIEESDEEEED